MEIALQLAKQGMKKVSPNPMVGCVIVHDGEIIGQGFHEQYGGPHAEVNAITNIKDQSLLKDKDFVLSEIKKLEDSILKIRALGINDYESQSEVLNEQWARAKIANNHSAANAIAQKLEILSKYGGQYSALRDDLVHSRGRLNYVQKKLNEHKLTAEENLEHKFIVNAAGPALKKSYPIRWLIVVVTAFSTVLFMVLIIALKEQIKGIKQS